MPQALPHVFVVTRLDLPQPHRAVQVAHGAIAAERAFGRPERSHPNLVVCAVPDEPSLVAEFERLKQAGVPCCMWREEDLDGSATAIGTAPLDKDQRKKLRDLKLLPG